MQFGSTTRRVEYKLYVHMSGVGGSTAAPVLWPSFPGKHNRFRPAIHYNSLFSRSFNFYLATAIAIIQ